MISSIPVAMLRDNGLNSAGVELRARIKCRARGIFGNARERVIKGALANFDLTGSSGQALLWTDEQIKRELRA